MDQLERLWELQANLPISKARFRDMLKSWQGKESELEKKLRAWLRSQSKELLQNEREQWERRQSESAEQRLEQLRPLVERERQSQREQMSLGQWIDSLLANASLLTSGPAQSFEATPVQGSKPESRPPSNEAGLLLEETSDSVADFYEPRLRLLARNLQREIDRHKRKAPHDENIELTAREQHEQRILREGRGFQPWEVAAFDRSAGHPDTVRRMRDRNNVRRDDGEPREEQDE